MAQDDLTVTEQNIITSVCICTFRRPQGLRKLLASLAAQHNAPPYEVVVVDNDPDGQAEPVTRAFREDLNLVYVCDPFVCLAGARNRSVREAKGEFLAFVDDDETVSPTWLTTMHRVLVEHEAAVVCGPVKITFEDKVPLAVRGSRIFKRTRFPNEGESLPWFWAYTGNAYVRRSIMPDPDQPFEVKFGRTGGEDVDCFRKIHDAGGRLISAGEGAMVHEFREHDRANYRWILRRSIRNGGNLADMQWKGFSPLQKIRMSAGAMYKTALYSWQAFRASNKDAHHFVERTIDAGEQLGRALSVLGYRYPEYGSRK
ncbi:MAG TPA: glycosyltransferase family 2 protein [Kiritimatiellia bacterium]|nr:glycosyltransferase family 2 protein [Kiritimatiellia bacterium]